MFTQLWMQGYSEDCLICGEQGLYAALDYEDIGGQYVADYIESEWKSYCSENYRDFQ